MSIKHAPHLENCLESFEESLGVAFRGVSTEIVICRDCKGRGVTTLRDFAFTADDFAEDPVFADDYRDGFYDETCAACNGQGRYFDLSDEQAHPEVHARYREWLDEVVADVALMRAESGYMY